MKDLLSDQVVCYLDKAVVVMMVILVFLNPIPHITTVKEVCFYLSVLIVAFLAAFKKIHIALKVPLTVPLAAFVVWAFVGIFFALNKENSFDDFCFHLVKYLVIYYVLVTSFASQKRFLLLAWTIILSAAALAVGAMFYCYVLSGQPISLQLGHGLSQTSPNIICIPILFGTIFALYTLSTDVRWYSKLLLAGCISGNMLAMVLSQSRGALLATALSSSILLLKSRKILILFFAFFAVLLFLMPVKNRLSIHAITAKLQQEERIGIWYGFAEVIKDYPIMGTGFGMSTFENEELLQKYCARVPAEYRLPIPCKAPHNIVVDITVRLGLVGLILFLYILFKCFWINWVGARKGKSEFIKGWSVCLISAFIGVLTQGMFENTSSGPPAIILFTIFALTTILWRLSEFTIPATRG